MRAGVLEYKFLIQTADLEVVWESLHGNRSIQRRELEAERDLKVSHVFNEAVHMDARSSGWSPRVQPAFAIKAGLEQQMMVVGNGVAGKAG